MDDFRFYNSENDGYRGGFGDYADMEPVSGGPEQSSPQPPKKKKGGAKRIAALVLACAIVGGGAGVGGAALYQNLTTPDTVVYEGERPQVQTMVNSNSGQPMTPEQLYAANLASCVGITVNTTVNIFGQTTTSAASGSGFVLTQDGYIVTNYHVIEEAVDNSSVTIEVSFANGDQAIPPSWSAARRTTTWPLSRSTPPACSPSRWATATSWWWARASTPSAILWVS